MFVDPLAEKYKNVGGYVYVANNPINFIDPDGRKIVPRLWLHNNESGKLAYSGLDFSVNSRSAFSVFQLSKTGQNFLSKFMKTGETFINQTAKTNGAFSKYALEINTIDHGNNASAKGSFWGKAEASFGPRVLESGELTFQMKLRGNMSVERLIENIAHEGLLHAYDSKISSVIKYYEKHGADATRNAISEGMFNFSDLDHKAIRDGDVTHPGYNNYNNFRNEMDGVYQSLGIENSLENTFKGQEKTYEDNYKNIK